MHQFLYPFPLPPSKLLGSIILCFIVFVCWMGLHIDALGVYWAGGTAFVEGLDPYAYTAKYGPLSQFKYSPLFALAMAGLAKIEPPIISIGVWTMLSMAVCVWGLLRWMDGSTRLGVALVLALIAGYIDLSICLWANQANALVIGLSLIGLDQYRRQRHFSAGLLLVLATFLKVYPVVFLAPLALRGKPRYWEGVLVGAVLAFAIPICFVGWSHDVQTHIAWFRLLWNETHSQGILDLGTALHRLGMHSLASRLPWLVALISLPLLLAVRYLPSGQWRPWVSMACATVVLLSPKTEVFTYVFLAPAYSLMAMHCIESSQAALRIYGTACCIALSALMIACQFSIEHWMISQDPMQIMRVLGALGYWLLCVTVLVQAFKPALENLLASTSSKWSAS